MISTLGSIARDIGTGIAAANHKHALAVELWATGNHDARVLACMVADPGSMTTARLNDWSKDLRNYVLTDAFAGLAARSPHAEGRLTQWTKSRKEWISSAGWSILSGLAVGDNDLPDNFFAPWL